MTLKSAVYFGIVAAERKTEDLSIQSIAFRNAMNASKDGFKEFLTELEDGN